MTSPLPASPRSVAVIGGGLTGLSAAYHLSQAGHSVRLFERGERLGGAVRSERRDGFLVEFGPNSLQASTSDVLALCRDLGLEPELQTANPQARQRYLVRDGRLQALPLSPPALLRSRLFSWRAKLRLLTEVLRRPRVRATDLSLAAFVQAHFGAEIVDYALEPFVGGVYAGDPTRLSARHAFPRLWEQEQHTGSLVRAQIAAARARRAAGLPPSPPIVSFRHGLQVLTDTLAAALPKDAASLNVQVESLLPVDGRWQMHWRSGDHPHRDTFDRVVLALPGRSLAGLAIGSPDYQPLAELKSIEYAPVSSLFLGFARDQVQHPLDGFGVLVPAAEQRTVLGVLFSSSLFPDRAPPGQVALTVMVGGTRQPRLVDLDTPEALFSAVQADLQAFLGLSGRPSFMHLRRWPEAIPQYNLGYERHLAALTRCEQSFPGVLIGGHVRDGIALSQCLVSGKRLAARAGAD